MRSEEFIAEAVALSQSQVNLLPLHCCMGVVSQIEDLDNSSAVHI